MTPEQWQLVLTSAGIAAVVSGAFGLGTLLVQRKLARSDAKQERERQWVLDRLLDTRRLLQAATDQRLASAFGMPEYFEQVLERTQRHHFPLADLKLVGDDGAVRAWLRVDHEVMDLGRGGGVMPDTAVLIGDIETRCIIALESQIERALRDEPLARISAEVAAEILKTSARHVRADRIDHVPDPPGR